MKIIAIEEHVYKISDYWFNILSKSVAFNPSTDHAYNFHPKYDHDDVLGIIQKKYKPILELDGLYNY